MREFILFSRTGYTDGNFTNLREAGRLDLVYQCALTALFVSHNIRSDVIFRAVLTGPPKPPLCITIDGSTLHDVRVDEITWTEILKNVLSGKEHPGITVEKKSLQELVKRDEIYVLEEGGEDISKVKFGENPVFVIGDHVGLPKNDENFVLRYGKKLSLGKQKYLAASCVDIINYNLDRI